MLHKPNLRTESKRRDAVDTMLKVQTTLDQIKRDSVLLVTEVESLQARRALLFKQLADVNNAHAGVEEL